jgi:hypothetical protein
MKEYLFYFDNQQIYKNRYVESWIELITYQVIIFKIIVFLIFLYSIPSFFSILIYYRKIKWNFLLVPPDFQNHTTNLQIYFICNR